MSGRRDIQRVEEAAATGDPAASNGVFVGVRRFRGDDLKEIRCAVDDAVDLAHLFAEELGLIRPQRVCLALSGELCKAESEERLERLLSHGARRVEADRSDILYEVSERSRRTSAGNLFVLSFATHGFESEGGHFLATSDTRRNTLTHMGLRLNALSEALGENPAALRLLLLDTCRDQFAETRSIFGLDAGGGGFAQALKRFEDEVVLCAAPAGGFAFEDRESRNGVFTGALLDGLRGAAPLDDGGFVTLGSLAEYTNGRVLGWIRENQPEEFARLNYSIKAEMPLSATSIRMASPDGLRRRVFRRRRRAGLERLGRNLEPPLGGRHYDAIRAALDVDDPAEEQEALLVELECLDGGVRARRSLAYFVEQHLFGASAPPPEEPSLLRRALDLRSGVGGEIDYAGSLRLIEQAAERGEVAARVCLADLRKNGSVGVPWNPNVEETLAPDDHDALRRLAEQGSVEAALVLGYGLESGLFGDPDAAAAMPWWKQAAEAGDPSAMCALGYLGSLEGFAAIDVEEGLGWLRRAAEAGHATALNNLGWHHRNGLGVGKDLGRAAELYRTAADRGLTLAMRNLASCHAEGEGVEQDEVRAAELYRTAAELGDAKAIGAMAMRCSRGRGVERDGAQAVEWCRRGMELNDPFAIAYLGALYADGDLVEQDVAEAAALYRRAAALGWASAMHYLGQFHEHGLGVEQDDAAAVRWYRKSAEAGDSGAMRALGDCLAEGRGVDADPEAAVQWYRRAVEEGDTVARWSLGLSYDLGRGVPQDLEKARSWYLKAADEDVPSALNALGVMYGTGRGVELDASRAVSYYTKAAEMGNSQAMRNLAILHLEGLGVRKSRLHARQWLLRAIEAGHPDGESLLGLLEDGPLTAQVKSEESPPLWKKILRYL